MRRHGDALRISIICVKLSLSSLDLWSVCVASSVDVSNDSGLSLLCGTADQAEKGLRVLWGRQGSRHANTLVPQGIKHRV